MFLGGIITRQDLEEAAKLQRRRQFEETRKKRIFDTKRRILGVDSAYLERQINEKEQQQSRQHEVDRRHAEKLESQQLILRSQELEEQKLRRCIGSDIDFYRLNYQRKEQAREYDLNDPDALRKSKPVRLGDSDSRLGVSSAQIFDGEDLSCHIRHRHQTEQQRAWWEQQIRERQQAECSKRQADNEREQELRARECFLTNMAESEQRVRAQVRESVNEYNRELAKQKRFDRERIKREKMEDDLAEIYNMLTSDILSEDPAVGQSCLDPNKRLPYMYRGMKPDEKYKFQLEQAAHRRDKQARLQMTKNMERASEEYTLHCDRELKIKELEFQEKEKQSLQEFVEYNRELANKQREEHSKTNTDMKRNEISDKFFHQFNTTSR